MPGPRFGSKKQPGSLDSHCTKWVDELHRPVGFELRFVPDLPIPLIPTLIGLRVIDLVSRPVLWKAEANIMISRFIFPRIQCLIAIYFWLDVVYGLYHTIIQQYVHVRTFTYEGWLKSSSVEKFILWRHLCCWWVFWQLGSKHGNTGGRSMWTEVGTMLKNKPYLVIFHESILVSLGTFRPTSYIH